MVLDLEDVSGDIWFICSSMGTPVRDGLVFQMRSPDTMVMVSLFITM